jgi:hypothetical protein
MPDAAGGDPHPVIHRYRVNIQLQSSDKHPMPDLSRHSFSFLGITVYVQAIARSTGRAIEVYLVPARIASFTETSASLEASSCTRGACLAESWASRS